MNKKPKLWKQILSMMLAVILMFVHTPVTELQAESTDIVAQVKDSVYWNEEISFELPEQNYEGFYRATWKNLSVTKENGDTISLTDELEPGLIITVKADKDIDSEGSNTNITLDFSPEDENNESFTKAYSIKVNKVPVKAVWNGSFSKTYDGTTEYSTQVVPEIVFDVEGTQEYEGYEIPTLTNSGEFHFTLDQKESGNRCATLNEENQLVLADEEHYDLTNAIPSLDVTVTKKVLEMSNVTVSNDSGKAYDGTSKAVVTAELNNDNDLIVPEDFAGQTMSLSYEADYYVGDHKVYGNPNANTEAEKLIISNLEIMENDEESANYCFAEGLTISKEGNYVIASNAGFLEFTGISSVGTAVTEERNEEQLEIHWFHAGEPAAITQEGYEFSEEPENLAEPVWNWMESYTVSASTPKKIYARNTQDQTVSGSIWVALDDTAAAGQIFAQIGDGAAVSITELTSKYQNLSKGANVTVRFDGADADSKISEIDVYGSDTAWDSNDETAWENLIGYTTSHVNQETQKEVNVTQPLETITSEQELKKFYYARITDFAGNVSYISSAGVLQDITAPTAELTLANDTEQKVYNEKNVYEDSVGFTLKIEDLGKSSGISKVELQLKNHQGSIVETYSTASDIWSSQTDIAEIKALEEADHPTEAQIQAANACVEETGLRADLTNLPDGNYTLTAKVTDKVGNESAESTVSFIKDSVAPVINLENHLTFHEQRTDTNFYTGGYLTVTVKDMTLTTQTDQIITGIDDNAANWNTTTDSVSGLITKTITLKFGAREIYKEGNYNFNVSVSDAFSRPAEEATGNFTIDYTAPTFGVTYSDTSEDAYTEDVNKKYYNRDLIAEFTIHEETSYEDAILTLLVKNAENEEVLKWENGSSSELYENYLLEHQADTKQFKLTVKGVAANDNDGYTFHITGKDKAGNSLVAATAEDTGKLGITRVMDVTSPVLENVQYDTNQAVFQTVGERDYVNQPTKMTFSITEHHPRDNQSSVTSNGQPVSSQWSRTETENDGYTTSLNVPMLGEKGDEQTVTLTILDKAGNKAVLGRNVILRSEQNTIFDETTGMFQDQFTVDTVRPVISLTYEKFNPDRQVKGSENIDYFKQPITVNVSVDEHNFDESQFQCIVERTDPSINYVETPWTTEGDIHRKTFTYDKDNQYDLTIIGTDNALNKMQLDPPEKMSAFLDENRSAVALKTAVDTTLSAIGDTAKPVIVITPAAAPGTTVDGHSLYHTDVTYEVAIYDPLYNKYASGIDNIVFSVKGEDGTTAAARVDKTGKIVNDKGLSVIRVSGDPAGLAKGEKGKYIFYVTISKDVFNTNGIVLSVESEDVSTNRKTANAKEIAIDITAPKAVVSYDNNEVSNEKYFHEGRTASITVTERNFSNDCLEFIVNGDRKKLEFHLQSVGSKNRDDAVWSASYRFEGDGDYHVECVVKDRATNMGEVTYAGEAPQEFTIDTTAPKVEIEFDNHHVFNDNYYDAQRTATIIITEHNFNGNDVVIIGEAVDAGVEVPYPQISAWTSDGDVNRATLVFAEDALYTLDVEYEDLATNVSNDVEEEKFTVDTTDPEVKITGVENETPYPDEVRPRIDFSDNNFDRYEVMLTRTERENHHVDVTEELVGTIGVSVDATGKGIGGKLLEDLEHLEENDGIYSLSVTVYDKAGRSSEETIVYSVNRFGSVYVYSEDLVAMLNGYHQTVGGDLYITAYNANRLLEDSTKLEITCDGATISDQKSQSNTQNALIPNTEGWYEYQFDLSEMDFAADGHYVITISDKDEAGNTKTNSADPVEFYVDATAPMLDSVIGLEKAIVNANEQVVQYAVSDAIALKNIRIFVDDTEVSYIEEFEDLTAHQSEFTIHSGMKQKVRIVAEDKAGNVMDTAEESFTAAYAFEPEITVSTNLFIRWYANTILFWGSVIGVAVIAGAGVIFLVYKKRKETVVEEM